ncbi:NAD(P)-dependent alcohol dehydrogenase [Alkalimonas delamerensis]|uniref:NAD(P)-dependent alcohol dehydrogenase n=1 Tax=Alkalimonas delamerensis TaxID=265981 RepID=A0ABT9GNC0_9GAMM|nr:NAD(P)-dependent alcohol dehydrogenase [Alkalimonas delamerensis]MDP4528463.1 NAD(P)-dependent alcohol dehydrogenase [Alkalimonas delamerensis]
MKALRQRQYGCLDSLELSEVKKPIPAKHQVLIKVHAVSINDWDWALLHGSPFIPNRLMVGLFKPSIIVGSDIAGRIEAVGSHVSRFKPGDEVYGDLSGCGFGGFAEFVCAPEDALIRKPPSMSFEQAAAIPQAGMLALQGIRAKHSLPPDQKVLINGAGGGVGSIAVQLLKPQGVEVTGVDSAEKLALMRCWGFDQVIDYRAVNFTRNGQRYDLIIDVKTEQSPKDYERALSPGGVYATVGGQLTKLLRIALSGLRIQRERDKKLRVIGLQANGDLAYFNELFESGHFKPVLDKLYDFTESDVRQAFQRFGVAAHNGKIVVRLSHL